MLHLFLRTHFKAKILHRYFGWIVLNDFAASFGSFSLEVLALRPGL